MQTDRDHQTILEREGYVVVPTPLTDSALRQQIMTAYLQHFRESPEFRAPHPEDPEWQPVLGGFAGLANPSSYHHPFVRKFREMITAAVLESDALPIKGRRLEKVFDRLIHRAKGQSPTAESMHRDESPNALPDDVIFGGWVNMELTEMQYFSGCPRTHTEVGNQNKGFAKITSKEEQGKYRPQFRRIEIPPGHCLIFYERLVHEVVSTKADHLIIRCMLGWRITDAEEPLFGTAKTNEWINWQGVPKLKSSQDPPVFPSNYYNFPKLFQRLTDWSQKTFVPQCLYTHGPVASGAAKGTMWVRVKPKMLSLQEYQLPKHPAYDQDERRIVTPQRAWNLYTFDSPGQRVQLESPSELTWRGYVAAQHAAPLGAVVVRPRPGRVSGAMGIF